jgi:hypothetical protein
VGKTIDLDAAAAIASSTIICAGAIRSRYTDCSTVHCFVEFVILGCRG